MIIQFTKQFLLSFLLIMGLAYTVDAQYCTPGAGSAADDDISRVSITGAGGTSINNLTVCYATTPQYCYYGAASQNPQNITIAPLILVPGQTYSITIELTQCSANFYNNVCKVWIDYNKNFTFDEPAELAVTITNSGPNFPATFTNTFTVPANATLGATRMRVMDWETTAPATVTPCGIATWGETEDYDVTLGTPSGNQVLPPIAGIYPSMATPNPTSSMDTVWLNSPQKLVSTSTNAGRSYWDLPDETFLEPGYSRTPVKFTTQEYIDTAKYNQSFTYTFKRRGFWPVRLLAVGATRPDSLRDSTVRYIYVDTPGTAPVSNFFTPRRKIGFGEYTPFVDLSDKGPNQWFWYFYNSTDSTQCNKCNNQPFFPNFFGNPMEQNPLFFGGDPGKWSICLQTWNARGWDTTCYKDYLEILNSYFVCSGSGASNVTDQEGFLFAASGPNFSYTRSQVGTCAGILIKPCADSVIFYFDRLKMLPSDSVVFHNGSNASAPVIATIGGSSLSSIPAGIRLNGVRGGRTVFMRYKLGTATVPVPYDSAGFAIRWTSISPSYGAPKAAMEIPDTIYSLQPVQFQTRSTGQEMLYAWDTDGDGTIDSTGANPTRTFLVNTTNFKNICHVAYNCVGTDTVCKVVMFLPVFTKPEARMIADKYNGFNTDTFRLFDKSLNGPNSWRWTFTPAAQFLSGTNASSRNPVVRLTLRTKYTVKLVVTNAYGKDSVTNIDYINIGAYDQPQCLNDINLSDGSIGIRRVMLDGGIDTLLSAINPCYEFIQGNQYSNLYRGQTVNLSVVRPATTNVSPMDRKVWIDFNMDGLFGSDEIVMNESGSYSLTKTNAISISNTQRTGSTRMRVGVTYSPTTLNPSVTFLGVFKDFVVNFPVDTVRPTSTLNGAKTMQTEINKPFVDPGITASDNVEGNISNKYEVFGTVNTSQVGPNYLKYVVRDNYGNRADTLYRVVFVILNQSGPTITLNGPSQQYVEVFNKYNEFGVVARDNQNNIIPNNNIIVSGSVDTTRLGGYNLNYTVLDAFGFSATINRLVTVGDTTRPVITPNYTGGRNYYVHQVKTAIDMEKVVSVTDNYWKDLVPNWLGTVDVNNVGSYFIPYNVTDLSGNIANQVMVEIKVTDNIAPVIQLNGNNPLKWEVYKPYIDPLYNVTDNVWPKGTISITMKPAVIPVNSLGSITRWYIATDPSGNKDSVSRIINIVDETKPVVKILGGETVNINRWCEFVDPGVELQDNYNSDAEMRVEGRFVRTSTLRLIEGQTNRWFGDVPGLFSVTYRVTDLSGNQSDLAIRYVNVSTDACVTGVSEVLNVDKLMSVYPNPSTGIYNFRLVQVMDNDVKVTISDIQGKEVATKIISGKNLSEESLDLSSANRGIYIMKVETGSKVYTMKLQLY